MNQTAAIAFALVLVATLAGCITRTGISRESLAETDLEEFFRTHKVDGNYVAALKKRSAGVVAYLATIHGYPNNLSVCEELIVPYNRDASKSVMPGEYYCEVLR